EREDGDLTPVQVDEPALADAVSGEPRDFLFDEADARPRRQHLDHEVRRSLDAIADDGLTFGGDEQDVGLYDEVTVAIEHDIHRRREHFPKSALSGERREQDDQVADDALVAYHRRLGHSQGALRKLGGTNRPGGG